MVPKNKTAFLTTVFSENKIFLKDFFNSLHNQSDRNFDILILNDGFNTDEIKSYIKDLSIFFINIEGKTPAKNREILISKALELGYKYLIFGDSDDCFSNNRIKETVDLLKKYGVVVNDLVSFRDIKTTSKMPILTPIYKEGKINPDILYDYNIAGMSNTAIRSDLIKFPIDFSDATVAVDWLFFSQIYLFNKTNFYFTGKIKTYYRQHGNNTIGFNNKLDKNMLKKIIKVKSAHYLKMIEFCDSNNLSNEKVNYVERLKRIKDLSTRLNDKIFSSDYIENINKNMNKIYKGWWSEAVLLNGLHKI